MTWYQYTLLSLSVVLYSLKDIQQFWGLNKKNPYSFFGDLSWTRKYKNFPDDTTPAFIGSTTFLVMVTDGVHLFQFLMKICLSIGIFNFTLPALYFWLGWTAIQWLTFKICSKS